MTLRLVLLQIHLRPLLTQHPTKHHLQTLALHTVLNHPTEIPAQMITTIATPGTIRHGMANLGGIHQPPTIVVTPPLGKDVHATDTVKGAPELVATMTLPHVHDGEPYDIVDTY